MTSLTEFFNKHEDDALKGISHKNSIIKRNIIAHMAVNGECTLSELTKQLHISVPTITKLVQELVEENIVTLCDKCHYAFDEGLFMDRLRPFGFNSREDIRTYIIDYLKGFYPDWSEEKVRYKKWD